MDVPALNEDYHQVLSVGILIERVLTLVLRQGF
jgi:hypothetical protein